MGRPSMIAQALQRLRQGIYFWKTAHDPRRVEPEPALRSPLFNTEQMEAHAVDLASRHTIASRPGPDRLLPRLEENRKIIADCCRDFTRVTQNSQRRHVSPAAEWLLDNYWMVEEQIHTARKHLPKGYSKELPQLASGDTAGLPRVYDLALQNISHGDGRLDKETLTRFVAAYQTVSSLTIGELWAIPIMLRLALIENLRRVALRVRSAWQDQQLAEKWADHLIETASKDRKSVLVAVADMVAANPPITSAFVAEISRRLQGQSSALSLPLNWMEELLSERGLGIDQLIQLDTQNQAADQVSISNSINSLRMLAALDWREFVESMSVVERVLRRDPSGVYPLMDFASRDAYRHAVETLAKKYGQSESQVADQALALTDEAAALQDGRTSGPYAHIGFFLVDRGQALLRKRLRNSAASAPLTSDILERVNGKEPTLALGGYLLSVLALSLVLAHPFYRLLEFGHTAGPALALGMIAVLMVVSQLSLKIVNWVATILLPPCALARMDYSNGLPDTARTLVVVPTLIGTTADVDDQLEKLEVYRLANPDPNLQFGLLTDFKDAKTAELPGDDALLAHAERKLAALNEKYPGEYADTFFLCHRPRVWSEGERAWIGHERKRGKLCDFNALVNEGDREKYALVAGNTVEVQGNGIPHVRYVITLDADTQLPRDTAVKMIGSMAHPLNRPVYDPRKGRVVSGYAIMQPRVGVTLSSSNRTRFARLFNLDAGIDPYTHHVSDVYQDLFRQGSYIGKGIYDVAAFEQAVRGRFPDNRILSHDLIEGCYARCSLLTDVLVYEDFPPTYSAETKRRHRWIRGDWQLLPWVLPWVRQTDGKRVRNPLSALSRWKLIDNLRRSLVPPALIVMLLAGWFVSFFPLRWTLATVILLIFLPIVDAFQAAARKPEEMSYPRHLGHAVAALGRQSLSALLSLAWLPFEAWYSADAAVRTLWRLGISKHNLLQWNPSHDAERTSASTLDGYFRAMAAGPVLAVVTLLGLIIKPQAALAAIPLALLWVLSPAVAWWISKPEARTEAGMSDEQRQFLRRLTRRTWAFFCRCLGEEDNWLPPDNIQEQPTLMVAHRTSPTNMGLCLLAQVAAFDLGYIPATAMLETTGNTLASMDRLERHRGHFYNWYDTRTLEPLHPQYVSSVDSGNLAGHLLVLRQALLGLADEPVCDARLAEGLMDTMDVLAHSLPEKVRSSPQWRAVLKSVPDPGNLPDSVQAWVTRYGQLVEAVRTARDELSPASGSDMEFWFTSLLAQGESILRMLESLCLPEQIIAANRALALPTYRQLADLDPADFDQDILTRAVSVRGEAKRIIAQAHELASRAGSMAQMDFTFLFDRQRNLLSIGYSVTEGRLDASFYDLLASEARLTYYVAIAQDQIPQESWFSLGRLLTGTAATPVLLSWSGSMFEYLMPDLVMPTYENSLLDETARGAVKHQVAYGRDLKLPWGVSESAYNIQDANFNYQYRAFGVPGLGLKRGLGEDVVLAPYASVLAAMVDPEAAARNLMRLSTQGMAGRFGMYEAVDYTVSRLPRNKDFAVIYSYMAHHQGMALLALTCLLKGRCMQRRFLADPALLSARLLLEERMPSTQPDFVHTCKDLTVQSDSTARGTENTLRIIKDPDRARPAVQLLSNGNYHVMVSSSGGGYSRHRDMAVTRWRPDATRDHWGAFCYLRDLADGHFWSATHQPVCGKVESYEAIFSDGKAEFKVRERGIDAHTEIAVSPEDDVELRRVRLTNRSKEARRIELTGYAEVALANPTADAQHPAFSKLFIETELLRPLQALICSRRPSAAEQPRPYMFQLLAAHGADLDGLSYETDRGRFIGRNRDASSPAALDWSPEASNDLSGTAGAVLDPVASIRCSMTLEPGQTATIDLVTGVGEDRQACVRLVEKFRDKRLADRVFDLAWTHSQVLLHQFNATVFDAQLYEQMAAAILYPGLDMRADAGILRANSRGQSGLWGQSISGDNPVALVKVGDTANIDYVTQMVKAHGYWRLKGLTVDLVIWNEDHASYRQNLHDLILSVIPAGQEGQIIDRPGGIFVRAAQQLSREDRILIQSVARLIVSDTAGGLAEQIYRHRAAPRMPGLCPRYVPGTAPRLPGGRDTLPPDELVLATRYGGFSQDGSEYQILLREGDPCPAPWVNVLANDLFGSIVSESGSAYTWRENAHEFRLTPWLNDPVTDASGEALYLRDEATGKVWSPSPWPVRGDGDYRVRHGFGYSVFEHAQDGIHSELTVFVAKKAPVKISRLVLRNTAGFRRTIGVTGYVEWVLGDLPEKTGLFVATEVDPACKCVLARNAYTMDFPGRVAFFTIDAEDHTLTCDRQEFIGRNGSLARPRAMTRTCLSGRAGPGLDPCAALQTRLTLEPDGSAEVIFVLGAGASTEEAQELAREYAKTSVVAQELEAVRSGWKELLSVVRVKTPDPAVDAMLNGWLMYQSFASRYFGRSGFYQSGGAFGYRDQLQDCMAMVLAAPDLVRRHLLLAAAHQFYQGDVQHWWHPPLDRGVRTRCSDDFLWLPMAVERYIAVTGDAGVLDETATYLEARELNPDEESFYDLPMHSHHAEPLYDHCVRAIRRGLRFGAHGLPLMGGGDWNDGMDRVGIHGQGESVWLGFFTYAVLQGFRPLAEARGDAAFAAECADGAERLRQSLEESGWDGSWYRRAYFDDGTPLGSHQNQECRIDSISQSWAVLSGAAEPQRARQALESLEANLVSRDIGIIRLLTPPFDDTPKDPGYIKGYVPGVRENGGQYTHAAVWAAMAFAAARQRDLAWELAAMINPVRHGDTDGKIGVYKIEPYVIAADIYGVEPHQGRGGWSWYTGAAGWYYRLLLESLLGLRVEAGTLRLEPLLPADWDECSMEYRYGDSLYAVRVKREDVPAPRLTVDGEPCPQPVPLVNDGRRRELVLVLPRG